MNFSLLNILTDFVSIHKLLDSNDPLRSINGEDMVLFDGEKTKIWELSSLVNKAKKNHKDSGINPLCQTLGVA